MSLGLRLLVRGMRYLVRPRLQRTVTPEAARRDLDLGGRHLFRAPPFLLHLPGAAFDWIAVGPARDDRVILYLHGGAYVAGSPVTHRALLGRIGKLSGFGVAAARYPLAPEHPAPAQFDAAVAAHAALLARGFAVGQIILGGDSAGGGLALALLADLCARGLRPAGLFALSPWTDLALTGASLRENAEADPLLPVARMEEAVAMVRGALPPDDPRLSPLYARFVTPPPVFLQVGSTEILRDDSRRMAQVLRQAGGAVTLQEWPDAPHVWQMLDGYIPEARAALRELAGFLRGL
jgi:monoterpene epsilon-lactone hydrolase